MTETEAVDRWPSGAGILPAFSVTEAVTEAVECRRWGRIDIRLVA